MTWTPERVEILKKLWAEHLSASQIARTMGDVSRNAVIGKVHRLGLSARASRPRRPITLPKPEPKPVVTEEQAPAPAAEATLSNGEYITVMTLNGVMCRWPIGDPGATDFHFCGNQTESGDPYCTAHAELAYQPSNRTRAPTDNAATASARRKYAGAHT